MSQYTNNQTEIKPDHVINWLDKNMGESRNNRPSKQDLSNNAGVDTLPSDERTDDVDNFMCRYEQNMNNEKYNDLMKSPLRMFIDENECIKCIHDSIEAKKQTFLVVSGQMGKLVVPQIYKKLSGFIYIFCCDIPKHLNEWAGDYVEHIQMFDVETTLFIRLLRDIAKYYVKKSKEFSLQQASSIKYLKWAKRLVIRSNKMDEQGGRALLHEINDKLNKLETIHSDENDNDDRIGEDVDEG